MPALPWTAAQSCMCRLLCWLLCYAAGEEVVARESMISICWRLIPYWLNVWEQQWGAECSSMTFELPQFAVELLIILPCKSGGCGLCTLSGGCGLCTLSCILRQ